MGFGLPSAIGIAVARPDALVIDIDGDASFNMTLTELSTAAQFNIDVKVIVLNNEEQGMATQWQNLFYEDRYAHTHPRNPDFVNLADAMGVQSLISWQRKANIIRRRYHGPPTEGTKLWLGCCSKRMPISRRNHESYIRTELLFDSALA